MMVAACVHDTCLPVESLMVFDVEMKATARSDYPLAHKCA